MFDLRGETLRRLGEAINYNAYGDDERDVHIAPAKLYHAMARHADPFAMIAKEEALVDELDRTVRVPGLANIWVPPIRNRIDMLATGIKSPVGVKVAGTDLATIDRLTGEIERTQAQYLAAAEALLGTQKRIADEEAKEGQDTYQQMRWIAAAASSKCIPTRLMPVSTFTCASACCCRQAARSLIVRASRSGPASAEPTMMRSVPGSAPASCADAVRPAAASSPAPRPTSQPFQRHMRSTRCPRNRP